MSEISVLMLATTGGIALVVGFLTQLIVKPWLKVRYGEEQHDKYSAVLNSIVAAMGVLLGLVGAIVINMPPTPAQVVTGLLVGLVGSLTATGGAEYLGNVQKAYKK